jgi:hypothetical protein
MLRCWQGGVGAHESTEVILNVNLLVAPDGDSVWHLVGLLAMKMTARTSG